MARRWGWIAVTLVGVVLLSGCVMMSASGSGGSSGGPSGVQQPRVTASAASRVGESQTSGNWKLTVNSVQLQDKLADGESAKPGDKLMIVDVSFFNVGTTNYLVVGPGQAALADSKNRAVPEFPTTLGAFNGRSVNKIPVRYGAETSYVYEIPAASTGYIFSFKPDPAGKTVLRWRVP